MPAPAQSPHVPPTRPAVRQRGRPRTRRTGLVLLGTVGAVVMSAALASAHVVVTPSSTTPGTEAEMTFRVPTEEPTASTVKLVVTLPTDHPLAEVEVKPLSGWNITVVDAKLATPVVDEGTTITTAPHTVTWTAVDKQAWIPPDQFQDFSISAGPLPESGAVTFAAQQTYSDGSVVNWDQPTVAGQGEPEHPAPSFRVTAASAAAAAAGSAANDADADADRRRTDPTARWLAGAALVVALIGLGASAAQGLRGRSPR
jgi:periplasmic copper chaperone A